MKLDLDKFMVFMAEKGASDLFLTHGAPPCVKIGREMMGIGKDKLDAKSIEKLALNLLNPQQTEEFTRSPDINISLQHAKVGRFRINISRQRNEIVMVMRLIPSDVPCIETLGLPHILKEVGMEQRGLILFVGATGMGKSTSLASLINYRNEMVAEHIITIEDPIEFVHPHKRSIITQREVGTDTLSYQDAIRSALRQAPDVILIGEIRDQESMEYALKFAESGHLCLSTLHANNANQALDRIINLFPEYVRGQILMDLSMNLRGIVSQRLIPGIEKGTMHAAFEILINTPMVGDLIKKGERALLKEAMEKSEQAGMVTFDNYLLRLVNENKISKETALQYADSKNDLRLKMKLENGENLEPEQAFGIVDDNVKEKGFKHV